jgi:PKD repeat protein
VGDVAYGNFRDGFEAEGNSTGTVLHNCIATDNGLTSSQFDLDIDGTSTSGFQSDDNLFWNSTTRPPIKFGSAIFTTVASYSAASAQDGNTFQADPLFTDPAHGNFELRAGSPCIDDANSGVANWPSTDALGRPRVDDPGTPNRGRGPVTFADRGALEFQGSTTANQPPVARLTVSPSSGTAPLTVTADGSASSDADGHVASYKFDFGDGTVVGPQTAATAQHTFAAGTWTVRLTVTDDKGATGTASAVVTASGTTANQPPVARLTVTPSSGTAPLAVTANGSASSDADGTITSYRFDFGDGTVVGPQSGATATHTFAAGTWTVRLTVTDNQGATGTASAVVTVSAPPSNQAPVAHLTILPSTGIAPLLVTASGLGSSDPDGSITSYRFDFGDGTVTGPLVLATTTHIYSAGTWTARLTVTDNLGATGSATVVVTVQPGLPLSVAGAPGGGAAPVGSAPVSVAPAPESLPELAPNPLTDAALVPLAGNGLRVSPDPIRSSGRFEFSLSAPGPVSLHIFDLEGRRVRTVAERLWSPAGRLTLELDGHDDRGAPLRRGVYFMVLQTPAGRWTARFAVLP